MACVMQIGWCQELSVLGLRDVPVEFQAIEGMGAMSSSVFCTSN